MRRAKFALATIAVFTIIGGALAFKANRQVRQFYSLGQTIIDGQPHVGCVVGKFLQLTPVTVGGWITTLYSSAFQIPTTTCTARVTFSA
ncbi:MULTISPECIES: hypothetical protein [unclassified Chitinophaga]|uniref:hypothetical protein n=1 Tax=unclassified Chitinophaga TaxID=2619133 RepID=UPI0030103EF1